MFQELFEKIDQEDDGEVYLRFDKFSKLQFKQFNHNTTQIKMQCQCWFLELCQPETSGRERKSLFREVVLFLRAVNEDVDKNEKVTNIYLNLKLKFYLQYVTSRE